MADAVYLRDGEVWVPTGLSRGPWDAGSQHGGAPAALLAGAAEAHDGGAGARVARLTVEFLRPVPIAPLALSARTVRPGRRVQLVEATLAADGTEVGRALALRMRTAPGSTPARGPDERPPAPPETATSGGPALRSDADGETFGRDAVDIRWVAGHWADRGPGAAWIRLRAPIVAGEPATPLQRAVAAADFGNGLSAVLDWEAHLFVNPDLSVHLEREPAGEWVCVDAVTRIGEDGTGASESVLWDARGRFGRAVQALYVAPR